MWFFFSSQERFLVIWNVFLTTSSKFKFSNKGHKLVSKFRCFCSESDGVCTAITSWKEARTYVAAIEQNWSAICLAVYMDGRLTANEKDAANKIENCIFYCNLDFWGYDSFVDRQIYPGEIVKRFVSDSKWLQTIVAVKTCIYVFSDL